MSYSRAGFALGLAVALMALAPTAEARPVQSMMEQRSKRVMLQQWDISCGAAALGTLLRYQHGLNVTERDIAVAMMSRGDYVANPNIVRVREGFSLLDMRRYVASRGLVGVGLGNMSMDDLIQKAPAIVPIHRNGYNHFVVFRGLVGDRALLADPSFGSRTVTKNQFERLWRPSGAMGRVAFVIEKPNAAPSYGLAPRNEEFLTFN
jgi:predicted double-glycine peptidase